MVPFKFFQQLPKDLGDPQPHAIRNMTHWRPPILKPSARKITYRLFDIQIFRNALEQQNTLAVKEKVLWSGDLEVSANSVTVERLSLLQRAEPMDKVQETITCQSNFVVGLGEGRAYS